ncbi:hypothetical protein AN0682.2 [Aspergillus nidulans FGSC A4]|uniref:DUF202 domain-containing protein n=1 Tax=Emericella nidulans (strain FGSC A4 / ATCC 38163 / CBS 112.46 / NRRL 194 / M139) TaxID=227321 RepID=Q5BFJ8_EMENI|nr:hypothetical protein [Aspergillus nidulans FGSC A4]EAA65458.1 hypothetical protein AN0682.2 [Aspergillus nidulans FGSC A4]CBF88995.1 TPA: conserved hypothetical protein [Aspergillus nidulans FGSC A4]|eukprot:XP_658286.1 hypothetical protein AN0682.2 [Aspergillus nidulans FGSC A4]
MPQAQGQGQSQGHEQTEPVNEITPIVSHSSSQQRRRYNSTENVVRSSDGGSANFPTRQSSYHQDRQRENLGQDAKEPHASWYSRLADRYERTFLAWLRTSLAFASIGIAVTQLFRLSNTTTQSANGLELTPQSVSSILSPDFDGSIVVRVTDTSQRLRSLGKPLGTTFLGVAILILLVGFHRYFESQYWIIRGKFPASRGSIALIAFVAGALIIAALAVILAISPGAIET